MSVLDDLEKSIRKELEDSGQQFVQLTLWPEDERNQLKRDLESLKARLSRIPDEKKNEAGAIECRYADPTGRTFPVAVVLFVPHSMLGKVRSI